MTNHIAVFLTDFLIGEMEGIWKNDELKLGEGNCGNDAAVI